MTTQSESTTKISVIELSQLGKHFGIDPPVIALTDIDLHINAGEWLSITGPSGSGKSTLLNIIGCLDRQTSGTYLFEGIDVAELNDWERSGLRSQRIGFVFQAFHLLSHRTVLENVMLAEVYRNEPYYGRRDRAMAALEKVGMTHRADFLPTKLSGGEKQRVAIARALIDSPSLLLCDEPTGNLDTKSSAAILDLFDTLHKQGLTLVVVTHDETVAVRASRRVRIVDGKLTEIHTSTEGKQAETPMLMNANASSISRSGITFRDLFDEALAGMFARPGRMVLTMLGIVIGMAALVATLGLSRTASNRIIGQFDELTATEIFVTPKAGLAGVATGVIPWDAPARLQRLNGVVAAGTLSQVDIGNVLISTSPLKDPQVQTDFNLSVQAASPDLFTAVRADLATGRFFDLGHSLNANRVAVLGSGAAERLGIVSVNQLPAIAIGDDIYLVIGILRDVARQPDLLGSVIIPEGTVRNNFNLAGPGSVIVETKIGAASLIAQQIPLALRPDDISLLKIASPPEPQRVRDAVQSDLNMLFVLLGGLSLAVGAIGIANITLVSVIERTGEIGLRRSIGATRGHIAAQFLLESASVGFIGGVFGASLGILAVVGVSAYQLWTPVLDPLAPLLTPFLGGIIGLLAGIYPSLRAARMEPVEAFRSGT